MIGRLLCLVSIVTLLTVNRHEALPTSSLINSIVWLLLLLVGVFFLLLLIKKRVYVFGLIVICAVATYLYAISSAQNRLNVFLHDSDLNKVSRVHALVETLPINGVGSISFNALILDSIPLSVPRYVKVTWSNNSWSGPYSGRSKANAPTVKPGQVWRMALVLKPPYGPQNPGGFDIEKYAFASNIRAVGKVRGEPWLVDDKPFHNIKILANRGRYHIRDKLSTYISNLRYGPVILALSIGDQSELSKEDWKTFNRTGINHLVSISGTHVSIVTGIVFALVWFVWRRFRFKGRWLCEYIPAQVISSCCALLFGLGYCLLAGWGVPAQRAFYMLAVIVVCYVIKVSINRFQLLAIVAATIILFDPWAVISAGFWLSFLAVLILISIASSVQHMGSKTSSNVWVTCINWLYQSTRMQFVISIALLPVLVIIFNKIPISSPIVNFYAIPAIGTIATPLALLCAVTSCIPQLQALTSYLVLFTHWVIQVVMVPTEQVASWSLSNSNIPQPPLLLFCMAVVGSVFLLLPIRYLYKVVAVYAILPALVWNQTRNDMNYWTAYVLDVGQASAIVLKTRNHVVLFDTGARYNLYSDTSENIILPFLYNIGVNKIDLLVVSHADIDHVGGLRSILQEIKVINLLASFDVVGWLGKESEYFDGDTSFISRVEHIGLCEMGQKWHLDGVRLEIIWPMVGTISDELSSSEVKNNNSCVLQIHGAEHSILLTGDISNKSERYLVESGIANHDVVVVAHHGSRTSSDQRFVEAIRPLYAIIQSGAWNHYGHPHGIVVKRWENIGSEVLRTDASGAITITSNKQQLLVEKYRVTNRRYWHSICTECL